MQVYEKNGLFANKNCTQILKNVKLIFLKENEREYNVICKQLKINIYLKI